jgi:hypothetical protein
MNDLSKRPFRLKSVTFGNSKRPIGYNDPINGKRSAWEARKTVKYWRLPLVARTLSDSPQSESAAAAANTRHAEGLTLD